MSSAIGKLLDVSAFAESLSSWTLVNLAGVRWLVAVGVPTVELCLGLLWILAIARWKVALLQAVMVLIFGVAFALEVFAGGKPACSCFGVLVARQERADEVWVVVTRDILISAVAFVAYRFPAESRSMAVVRA